MDSMMTYIPIQLEVCIEHTFRYGMDIHAYTLECDAPKDVRKWVENQVFKTFERTREEELEMASPCIRTFEFEVEIFYKETAEGLKASRAVCHTVAPEYVKGWVEVEAMKQFNANPRKYALDELVRESEKLGMYKEVQNG